MLSIPPALMLSIHQHSCSAVRSQHPTAHALLTLAPSLPRSLPSFLPRSLPCSLFQRTGGSTETSTDASVCATDTRQHHRS
eukprot:1590266-Rhodomonas_salina.1